MTSTSPERGDDLLDRHLVPGERARLVRADHRGRAERLDRRQLLDDRPLAGHALHAEREHHRQDRRQPLGHGGDRERDADEQHVDQVGGRPAMSAVSRIAPTTTTAIAITAIPSMRPMRSTSRWSGVASLLRCARAAGRCGPSRSPCRWRSRRPGRARASTAVPLKTMLSRSPSAGRPGERRDVLEHRLALAGQRRLGDRQRRRLDQPAVGARRRRPRRAAARRPARPRRRRSAARGRRARRRRSAAAIRWSAATACSARASCT